jgi:hypothetical protein
MVYGLTNSRHQGIINNMTFNGNTISGTNVVGDGVIMNVINGKISYRLPNGGTVSRGGKTYFFSPSNEEVVFDNNGNQLRGPKPLDLDEDETTVVKKESREPINTFIELPEALNSEKDEEVIDKECAICLTRGIKTMIDPCGHCLLCVTCARTLGQNKKKGEVQCPTCKKPVDKIQRIYL